MKTKIPSPCYIKTNTQFRESELAAKFCYLSPTSELRSHVWCTQPPSLCLMCTGNIDIAEWKEARNWRRRWNSESRMLILGEGSGNFFPSACFSFCAFHFHQSSIVSAGAAPPASLFPSSPSRGPSESPARCLCKQPVYLPPFTLPSKLPLTWNAWPSSLYLFQFYPTSSDEFRAPYSYRHKAYVLCTTSSLYPIRIIYCFVILNHNHQVIWRYHIHKSKTQEYWQFHNLNLALARFILNSF